MLPRFNFQCKASLVLERVDVITELFRNLEKLSRDLSFWNRSKTAMFQMSAWENKNVPMESEFNGGFLKSNSEFLDF